LTSKKAVTDMIPNKRSSKVYRATDKAWICIFTYIFFNNSIANQGNGVTKLDKEIVKTQSEYLLLYSKYTIKDMLFNRSIYLPIMSNPCSGPRHMTSTQYESINTELVCFSRGIILKSFSVALSMCHIVKSK